MRISLECGLLEAGLLACLSSLCLAPPSFASPGAEAPATNSASDTAAVARIQEQQAALFEAVDRIRQHSEVAMHRYTDAVLTQFILLQESFAAQQARDLAAAERLRLFTRNVVGVMLGALVLSVLVIACLPLWAMHRLSRRIIDFGKRRGVPSGPGRASLADGPPDMEAALQRLERRLLSLETGPAALATPAPVPEARATLSRPVDLQPRVALAVGQGSALVFLPHEVGLPRVGRLRRHLVRLKKLLHRGAPPAQEA